MADISDVFNALVGLVAGFVYPNGTSQPPVAGSAVKIYPGWPITQQLDTDLLAGVCHVSVYPWGKPRNTTRYLTDFRETATDTATLTLTKVGQTVTVGGTVPSASNPTNLVAFVDSIPYVYQALPSDTLTSIAAALTAQIAAAVPGTTSSGPVITLPPSARIGAVRVGVTATVSNAVRTQERVFQVRVWANTPMNRDLIAAAIGTGFAPISRITLPDTSVGMVHSSDGPQSDQFEKSVLYWRDLMVSVEYSTLQSLVATEITQIELNVAVEVDGTTASDFTVTEFD